MKTTCQDDADFAIKKFNLKTYNKILKKLIVIAKKGYYNKTFNKLRNNMKKTWGVISKILGKSGSKGSIDHIIINNNSITDKKEIVKHYNAYFSRIASQMASDIPKPDNGSFKSYLNNPITNNFNFKPVSESDIHSIITNLNSKTSSGHDQISLTLLKKLKNVLVTPITVIVNQSLKTGIFPDALKIAKILPVFKKGDTHFIQNYHPISLLPSISKIFEKNSINPAS